MRRVDLYLEAKPAKNKLPFISVYCETKEASNLIKETLRRERSALVCVKVIKLEKYSKDKLACKIYLYYKDMLEIKVYVHKSYECFSLKQAWNYKKGRNIRFSYIDKEKNESVSQHFEQLSNRV